jgi:hypothetical protein
MRHEIHDAAGFGAVSSFILNHEQTCFLWEWSQTTQDPKGPPSPNALHCINQFKAAAKAMVRMRVSGKSDPALDQPSGDRPLERRLRPTFRDVGL